MVSRTIGFGRCFTNEIHTGNGRAKRSQGIAKIILRTIGTRHECDFIYIVGAARLDDRRRLAVCVYFGSARTSLRDSPIVSSVHAGIT